MEAELNAEIVKLPNFPNKDVPHGLTAADNVVVRTGGATPELPSDALPHWELARKYDIIDFELGVKLTGAGFPVYKGQGSRPAARADLVLSSTATRRRDIPKSCLR